MGDLPDCVSGKSQQRLLDVAVGFEPVTVGGLDWGKEDDTDFAQIP